MTTSWAKMVPALLLVAASANASAGEPRGEARVVRVAAAAEAVEPVGRAVVDEYARREAADGRAMRVWVPVVQSDRLARAEALGLTEVLIKEVERATPAKVVGRREDADLILEVTVRPAARP